MGSKNLIQSKTFWGVALLLCGSQMSRWTGIELQPGTWEVWAEHAAIGAGTVLAVYGRIVAEKQIGIHEPKVRR